MAGGSRYAEPSRTAVVDAPVPAGRVRDDRTVRRPAPAAVEPFGRRLVRAVFRWDPGAFLFAVVCALCFSLGRIAYIGAIELGTPLAPYGWLDGRAILVAWALGICVFVAGYFIATALMALWAMDVGGEGEVASYRATLARTFWPCAAVIALCWSPWVIASMPATMDQDTIWQVLIWRTPAMWYDHHPWLTTALFGTIFDIGADLGSQSISIGVAGVVQSALYVAAMAASLSYVRRFRRARPIFWVALVWCCLVPAFPYYACRLEKDTLFCLGLIPFLILMLDAVRTRGRSIATPGRIVALSLLVLWIVLTKKTGIYIVVPTLVVLALYSRLASWQPAVIAGAVGIAGFALWQGMVLSAIGVGPGPSKELYSFPFQQTARYVALHPDDVTPEEREAISAVLPYDDLANLYNVTTADPVKDNSTNLEGAYLGPYLRAWLAMGLRHPGTYLTATLGTNLSLLYVTPFAVEVGNDADWVDENVDFFSQFLHDGLTPDQIEERDEVTEEGLAEWSALAGLRGWLNGYAQAFAAAPLVFFDSPAIVQFYLPFLCACCILSPLFRGARTAVFTAVVPWALIVAAIVIGPMALDRYFIAGLLGLPLLLITPLVCRLSRAPQGSAMVRRSKGTPRHGR